MVGTSPFVLAGPVTADDVLRIAQATPPTTVLDRLQPTSDAAQRAGKDAAANVADYARDSYQRLRGVAAAALSAGHNDNAAKAATAAYARVPDGQQLEAMAQPDGSFTIRARDMRNGGDAQMFRLSKEQFNEFLQGPAGQWDHLTGAMAGSLTQNLAKLTRSMGRAIEAPSGQRPPTPAPVIDPKLEAMALKLYPFRYKERTKWLAAQVAVEMQKRSASDSELQAAASKLFPWASQGRERSDWLAAQMQSQMQRKAIVPLPPAATRQINQTEPAGTACKRFPNLC
jgi:hypothetical protein